MVTVIKCNSVSIIQFNPNGTSEEINNRMTMAGIPDYLNDLNAMHEAEKVLKLEQRDQYWQHLSMITERGRIAPIYYLMATATATQRAEAFLLTLSLWKEESVSEATVEGLR